MTDDLSRPPFAAQRALTAAGMLMGPKGWALLSLDQRRAVTTLGAHDVLSVEAIRRASSGPAMRHVVFAPDQPAPDPSAIPLEIARALGPARLDAAAWRQMRALDRYVLQHLVTNARLFTRAYLEILSLHDGPAEARPCVLGHCELRISQRAAEELATNRLLGGRAFVLARTAGVRVARRAHEILDLHFEREAGPIELDHTLAFEPDGVSKVLWQAHVSTWNGEFFGAASRLAATTAASALADMLAEVDPGTSITVAGVYETLWRVGDADRLAEDATRPAILYKHGG
jgi:hypothetical protein